MTPRITVAGRMLSVPRGILARLFRHPIDVPLAHVVSIEVADPHFVKRLNKGIRVTGIQIPGVMTVGSYRHDGQVTWWDVGRGSEAVVITLRDEPFARLVLRVDDPGATREQLDLAIAADRLPDQALDQG